jgi:hypothetical protein
MVVRELVMMMLVPLFALTPLAVAQASIEEMQERREERAEHREEMRAAMLRRLDVDRQAWRIPAIPAQDAPSAQLRRLHVSASRYGPSTNRYVQPWGCESRDVQVRSRSGKYWGKYQFDRQTWESHGGDPATYGHADEAEQDRVASRVKYDAWPNC